MRNVILKYNVVRFQTSQHSYTVIQQIIVSTHMCVRMCVYVFMHAYVHACLYVGMTRMAKINKSTI